MREREREQDRQREMRAGRDDRKRGINGERDVNGVEGYIFDYVIGAMSHISL